MAYEPFTRVTASGTLYGAEQWACSVSYDYDLVPSDVDLTQLANAFTLALESYMTFAGGGWGSAVTLTRVRAANINAAGQTVLARDASPAPAVTGNGTSILPPQIAIVHSLRTGLPGRAFRGRVYWPLTAVQSGASNGRPDLTTAIQNAAAQFWSDVLEIDTIPTVFRLSVASNVQAANTPVTQVLLGNVFDTQRRRRNELAETYISLPLT